MDVDRNMVERIASAILGLILSGSAGAFHAYHEMPSRDAALAACQSMSHSPPEDECGSTGEKLYRSCNGYCETSGGMGSKICTASESVYAYQPSTNNCTLLVRSGFHHFRYPTATCPVGTVFVGPDGNDCTPFDQSIHAGSSQDISEVDAVFMGKAAGTEDESSPVCGAHHPLTVGQSSLDHGQRGNPISGASGNKYQVESDFAGGDGVPSFSRHYNSTQRMDIGLGPGWTHDYTNRIELSVMGVALVRRSNGRIWVFRSINGGYQSDPDAPFRLEVTPGGSSFNLIHPDGSLEVYGPQGQPLALVDYQGRATTFNLDTLGRITHVTGPFGHKLELGYQGTDRYRLQSVKFPDGRSASFSYDTTKRLESVSYSGVNPMPKRRYLYDSDSRLTGIINEVGARIATYAYDPTTGQGIRTERGSGHRRYQFAYGLGAVNVADAVGNIETLSFSRNEGQNKLGIRI